MKKTISGLALYLSILLLIVSIVRIIILNFSASLNTTYELSTEIIYTLIFTVLVLYFFIIDNSVWKYLFLILILLTFTDYFSFSYIDFKISILFIDINLIKTLLLGIHLAVNTDIFSFKKQND
jgi:hypothetical protein